MISNHHKRDLSLTNHKRDQETKTNWLSAHAIAIMRTKHVCGGSDPVVPGDSHLFHDGTSCSITTRVFRIGQVIGDTSHHVGTSFSRYVPGEGGRDGFSAKHLPSLPPPAQHDHLHPFSLVVPARSVCAKVQHLPTFHIRKVRHIAPWRRCVSSKQ